MERPEYMNTPSVPDPHAAPSHCENCGTPLQGHYCHQCGQSLLNPIRHAGHALEEVFESFWHLDGRVFRTLRDLMAPGRTAIAYITGHRARYIAPLRLFVILTVLTFFIGKLVVHVDGEGLTFDGQESAIGRAQTVAEVERLRDEALVDVRKAEKEAARVPGANVGLIAARTKIQGEAASRIAELEREPGQARPPGAVAPPRPDSGAAGEAVKPAQAAKPSGTKFQFNDNPWDAKSNPVRVAWLPEFANGWLNQRIGRAQTNIERMGGDADLWLQAFMGALPTALFVLVPVFALLLKVLYVGTRRLYLEHLVVALYSHAFLLLSLLALFVINAVQRAVVPGVATALGLAEAAVYLWMPTYLLLMQKRVYGQGWWLTVTKYLVLGIVYVVLVTLAAVYAFLAGLLG